MDEWCAVWFWPTDEESLKHVPTPLTFHKPNAAKDTIVQEVTHALRFFHWELEFPDVFHSERDGFDGIVGNPPWENSQPNPLEFFADDEPLIRTLGRLAVLNRIKALFAEVPHLEEKWLLHCGFFKAFSNWVTHAANPFGLPPATTSPFGRGTESLAATWRKRISEKQLPRHLSTPFRHQTGRIFTYKLFLEACHHLLCESGRLGMIVPSGLYTDAWSTPLRKLLLRDSQCDWLFGFINWDLIFNIYYRFKFVIVIVSKISPVDTHLIHTCFGRYDARDWEHGSSVTLSLPLRTAVEFSPVTLSVLEISTLADLTICRKIYSRSLRIGDNAPGWKIEFTLEFMMNTDAKHFPPREKWEAKGYRPDVFGRWIDSSGEVALPLYEGRMIGQFDCSQKGWVSGKGRSAVWRDIPFDNKTIEPGAGTRDLIWFHSSSVRSVG